MVAELRVYFECDARLRSGFHSLMKEIVEVARQKRCRFQLIATGGTPVEDFRKALGSHPDAWNVLLLDSEGPITGSFANALRHKRLDPSHEKSAFWMVQTMESWFLADVDALKTFYGNGLQEAALRGNPNIEEIPKADVLTRLKRATRDTKRGEYHKTKHAPGLLSMIDVNIVKAAAPNCERMFRVILGKLAES